MGRELQDLAYYINRNGHPWLSSAPQNPAAGFALQDEWADQRLARKSGKLNICKAVEMSPSRMYALDARGFRASSGHGEIAAEDGRQH